MILAGIVLKVGAYGLIRFGYGIFPDVVSQYSYLIGFVGVLSIIYGALNALAMKDFKKMVAYSSVSHMGFVFLGLASLTVEGWTGAIFQMVSHGFLSAMLFFIAGVVSSRVQSREIAKFSGLSSLMPGFTAMVTIAFFASLGLPGFSAFISEIMVLFGAFGDRLPIGFTLFALIGIVLGAAYFLKTLQQMFFGKPDFEDSSWKAKLTDLSVREWVVLLPLAMISLVLGIWPQLLLDEINPIVISLVQNILSF